MNLKRKRLESILKKLSEEQFAALWKRTYGDFPDGRLAELVTDYVTEQYDNELDGCIEMANALLTPAPKPHARPHIQPYGRRIPR
jgi:hypothetical protein